MMSKHQFLVDEFTKLANAACGNFQVAAILVVASKLGEIAEANSAIADAITRQSEQTAKLAKAADRIAGALWAQLEK